MKTTLVLREVFCAKMLYQFFVSSVTLREEIRVCYVVFFDVRRARRRVNGSRIGGRVNGREIGGRVETR